MAYGVALGALVLRLLLTVGCKADGGWAEDLGMDMCPEKELSPSYMAQMRENCLPSPRPESLVQQPNIQEVSEMKLLINKQQMQLEQLETLVTVLQGTVFQLQSAVTVTAKVSDKAGASDPPLVKDAVNVAVHGSYENGKQEKELSGT